MRVITYAAVVNRRLFASLTRPGRLHGHSGKPQPAAQPSLDTAIINPNDTLLAGGAGPTFSILILVG